MRHALVAAAALLLVLGGCASGSGEDWVGTTDGVYRYGFDFVWSETAVVMRQVCGEIAEQDPTARRMVSAWDTQLAYFSEQGYRSRVVVELIDEGGATAWRIRVTEEKEANTEQVNPDVLDEADWSKTEADGSTASRLLFELDRRLNPRESWRRDAEERPLDAR